MGRNRWKGLRGQEKTAKERNPMNGGDVMLDGSPLLDCGCIPSGLYQTKTLEVISSKSTVEVVDE
jgi:hypothetical protein